MVEAILCIKFSNSLIKELSIPKLQEGPAKRCRTEILEAKRRFRVAMPINYLGILKIRPSKANRTASVD